MKLDRRIKVRNGLVVLFAWMLCGFQASDAHITESAGVAATSDPGLANAGFFLTTDSISAHLHKDMQQGWEVLFDGTNTDKWRGKNSDSFPAEGWVVRDSMLFLSRRGGGDIITREVYGNFELVLDFNLTVNANSGVKYFVAEIKNRNTGKLVVNGPEYQIIDDFNYPEVKDHRHEVGATAACYLLYPPENKILYPAGKWNHVKIIARGKHVEHWLNGIKVLSYERGSADFLKRKATTKFADLVNYGELPEGHILLTDHDDTVYFKNIRIRRL
ncbi:MAG: DUF1080 domain-containing protein [Puia sp.]